MAVFLINPSDHSFGTAVITPRWLYVLAAATPLSFGDPVIVDDRETVARSDLNLARLDENSPSFAELPHKHVIFSPT